MTLFRTLSLTMLIAGTISSASGAGIELVKAAFDFGFAPQNGTLVHEAWIKSTSQDTLLITEIKTGCGCLSPEVLERLPLLPGDSQLVVFYWQTRGSVGEVSRSAFIYTNSEQSPIELVLTANVVTDPPLEASLIWTPKRVAFDIDKKRKRSSIKINLANNLESDISLKLIENLPQLELELPEIIKAGTTETAKLSIADGYVGQEFESSITLQVSGNQTPPYRVTIPVASGDFSFRPFFTTKDKK